MFRKIFGALLLAIVPAAAFAQVSDDGKPVKVITSADITGVTRFSSDTVYNLSGFCYVESGEVLLIEAGTIIKSNPGQAAAATALIVSRGGRIYAEGTATKPIIFTSVSDDLDNPNDIPLPPSTAGRGLWGGLILLGNAVIADTAVTNDIEGLPSGDPRNLYGGANDNDNSGVLKYVSVRHGGSIIGAANEINGITFGGVGRRTVVDYIEVFQNVDDAVEFFGGTVNVKHAALAFGGDDQVDYDEGFRGCLQFVLAIADTLDSDTYGEHDGAINPENATPYSTPLLSNVTAIGARPGAANINNQFFNIRDNAGAGYYNSIFTEGNSRAIDIGDEAGNDSRERLSVGDIRFENNLFGTFTSLTAQTWTRDSVFNLVALANDSVNPQLTSISYTNNGGLDPRPTAGSPANGNWVNPTGYAPPANPGLNWAGFFTTVNYQGAFENGARMWTCDWSFLSFAGYTPSCPAIDPWACTTDDNKPVKVFTSADVNGLTLLSRDTVYNLAGFVYVENTDTLIVEPGTIIKSNPGQAAAATALIVSRDGDAYMMGSCDCPIVMTSISDDVDNATDIPLPPSTAGRGLWGGLIILGNAVIADTAVTNDIEGLPSGDPRNLYGGANDNDNSGVYTYVSVRHGGSIIGAANEINGITFGGVGRGTVVNHIEVFQNVDDAVEFFGGTVNVKHAILAFGGDDQVDYDEGFRGGLQFVFAIADTLDSDTYGEHDGAINPENATPYSTPLLSNVTAIGARPGAANINNQFFNIRDNAGAGYFNSIFTEGNSRAIDVGDEAGNDSRERLSVGDIKFQNNLFGVFTNFTAQSWTRDSIFNISALANDTTGLVMGTINYGTKDSLDPRPDPTVRVLTWVNPTANYNPPANPSLTWAGFFSNVNYMGAFDPNVSIDSSWAANWSFLHCAGYLGDSRVSTSCCVGVRGNVDCDGAQSIDIADLTVLVDHLFISFTPLCCPQEGDMVIDSSVDIADLTFLVDHLFISFTPQPGC